jgi:ribosome-binding factor A
MSSNVRQKRVEELLSQELTIIIGAELEDPAISLVDVTNVVVSKDLRTAKIYVFHRDDEVTQRALLKGLTRATPYIRGQIAERCGLRVVPEIFFYYDDLPARSARVDELLRQLSAERAATPVADEKVE